MNVPEERETRCKVVDVESTLDAVLDIRESVGEREGELLRGRGACLANVVAGDRDGVPQRRVLRAPLEAIDDEAHRGLDRKAPRVLRHVFLQDVVLNRPAQLLR